jgi:SAM-dependent methyltransferase
MGNKDFVSSHYKGTKGKKYFKWQNIEGNEKGIIEARKFLPYIDEEDIVLDFGCGGGHILASINCKKKYGVEINPHARKEARKYGFPVYEKCSYIKEKVDKIISNHCLEHVFYPIETLKELRKCLKQSGILILCVPIDDWRTQKHYNKEDINHHLYTWTPQLLGNCLEEAGFEVDNIKIYTHAWIPKIQLVYRILPEKLFDFLCSLNAFLFKKRQIIAIAQKL